MNTTADASIKCRWCGKAAHGDARCPDVKAMEYHTDGTVKRVEFFAPNDYPQPDWSISTAGLWDGRTFT
jgi:hypothetical protein